MTASQSDSAWRAKVSGDVLSEAEKQAYQMLQDAITKTGGRRDKSKALLQQELDAGDLDLTTLEGRKRRSSKNVQHLSEIHSDCPLPLLQELTENMLKKRCTLKHEIWDINTQPETIVQSAKLLSNFALQNMGTNPRGGTEGSIVDDREEFGNHNFVFTYPVFHDADQTVKMKRGRFFYVPVDDTFLDHYAWLSFTDWARMRSSDYIGNQQSGEIDSDKRLDSLYYDFFVGKKDIAQAVAYKMFEAIKTAVVLYQDDHNESGVDLAKAETFLQAMQHYPRAESWLEGENKLSEPIHHYALSEKQKAFLLDTTNPQRNHLVALASQGVLHILGEAAELKVPVALSLDGASIDGQYLTSDPQKSNTRHYSRFSEGQWRDVAPESLQTKVISPDMPFERRISGFECPD